MIRGLAAPLGWRRQDLLTAAIVVRYHRGALPSAGQKALRGLSSSHRKEVVRLAAILRLANAFDAARDGRIRRLTTKRENSCLLIKAQGYSPRDQSAEMIAAARHLLETVDHLPVMVKAMSLAGSRRRRKPLAAKGAK
jgi:exopolyphosphatase/pppGpp-phosphohydrolase